MQSYAPSDPPNPPPRSTSIYVGYKAAQAKASLLALQGRSQAEIEATHWAPHHARAGEDMYALCVDLKGFVIKVRVEGEGSGVKCWDEVWRSSVALIYPHSQRSHPSPLRRASSSARALTSCPRRCARHCSGFRTRYRPCRPPRWRRC